MNHQELSAVLKAVAKPGRYTGGEFGQIIKDKEKVSVRFAVENIGFTLLKLIFQPGLVEKGDVQHTGFIHSPNFYQIHALADVGDGRGRDDHGGYAGAFARNQVRDAFCLAAVIILTGEPGNQIP